MNRITCGKFAAAALVATMAMSAAPARASLLIEYSLDNGATFTTLASGADGATVVAPAVQLGAFDISLLDAYSDSPGTASLSKLVSASLDISNNSNATSTIVFAFSDVNFALPVTPPSILLNSHIGGSVTIGSAANLLSFSSCVSSTNANLTSCGGADDVAGPGTPDITTATSFKDDQYDTITTLAAPYSITSILTLTLGAGSDAGFQANASLAPIPEPVSLSVLGVGMLGLGILRRRSR
jgi:hypothetical protein